MKIQSYKKCLAQATKEAGFDTLPVYRAFDITEKAAELYAAQFREKLGSIPNVETAELLDEVHRYQKARAKSSTKFKNEGLLLFDFAKNMRDFFTNKTKKVPRKRKK